MSSNNVNVGSFQIGNDQPLALIAGPCIIESNEHCLMIAEAVAGMCKRLKLNFIFKASFDKANRTSGGGFRGPGMDEGLKTLAEVRRKVGVPVLTDIHVAEQAAPTAEVCDVLQIPAFLCRQTDLLLAAGRTGKPVNVKKGQFMAPEQMSQAVEKIRGCGNENVLLTERGTFFGYSRLVNDFTGLAVMRQFAPVVMDATHSCQIPGGLGTQSGGLRQFVPLLARSGVAAGCDALFIEVHDQPDKAKSDAATVFPLAQLEALLRTCMSIKAILQ